MLDVISCASEQYFSTSWRISHSSFLGPRRPWNRKLLVPMWKICSAVRMTATFTFFGRKPCLSTCSRTMKKCCNGMWSESSIRPYFKDVSISSLTISFEMLTRLLLSMITGSRAAKTIRVCSLTYNNLNFSLSIIRKMASNSTVNIVNMKYNFLID